MIVDSYNRVHDYLRISLTDNCNLRCFYCMPEEEYTFTPASRLMQVDEIRSLAEVFVKEGVKKIRLTGGEPLVRKDAADIILKLSELPVNLTITTNGLPDLPAITALISAIIDKAISSGDSAPMSRPTGLCNAAICCLPNGNPSVSSSLSIRSIFFSRAQHANIPHFFW